MNEHEVNDIRFSDIKVVAETLGGNDFDKNVSNLLKAGYAFIKLPYCVSSDGYFNMICIMGKK